MARKGILDGGRHEHGIELSIIFCVWGKALRGCLLDWKHPAGVVVEPKQVEWDSYSVIHIDSDYEVFVDFAECYICSNFCIFLNALAFVTQKFLRGVSTVK